MLAGVTETTAGNVEATSPRRHGGADENQDQRAQERQPAAIKEPEDKGETAKDFQPWQIKRQPHASEPGQRFIIIDVIGKLNRIERLKQTGVNENPTDDYVQNSPDDFAHLTI